MKILTAILLSTAATLVGCDSSSSTTSESVEKNYEHYIGGNFATMQECVNFVKKEAQDSGKTIEIQSDKPNRVSGMFESSSDMFFYCEKKETGSNGTFFEAAYPRYN